MINKFILSVGCFLSLQLNSQTPVLVVESSVKLGVMGEEFFYFGFAAGDKIIFDFEEAKGKEIKEVEIVEMPATSRFLDYKTSKISKKIIIVPITGIYKFRFTSSAIIPRVCNYKIQRIPASEETQNFNTAVSTHTIYDTTFIVEEEQYMAKIDTVIINYQDRTIRVNPFSTPGSNKATFNFVLPDNTIGWSYYLSVTPAGQKIYEDANKQFMAAEESAVKKFPTYNLLAGFIFKKPFLLNKIQTGQEINYWIMEGDNVNLYTSGAQFKYIQKGKGINDYGKVEPRKGSLNFCFSNDSTTDPASVTVKITLIQVNEILQTREIKKFKVTPKNEMYLKN
jgi:hypothetical protein